MDQPQGELVIQTIAMPKDTNPNGDIFGGWLMSQMDLGSGILAAKTAQARVVTVAMEGMSFLEPVRVGDTVACYALGGENRAHLDDDPGGSVGAALHGWPRDARDARRLHLCGGGRSREADPRATSASLNVRAWNIQRACCNFRRWGRLPGRWPCFPSARSASV